MFLKNSQGLSGQLQLSRITQILDIGQQPLGQLFTGIFGKQSQALIHLKDQARKSHGQFQGVFFKGKSALKERNFLNKDKKN